MVQSYQFEAIEMKINFVRTSVFMYLSICCFIGYGRIVANAKQKWLVGQRGGALAGCSRTIWFRQLGGHQQTH